MPLESSFPIGRLDSLLIGLFCHPQNLVIVFLASSFCLLLSIFELLLDLEAGRVDGGSRSVVSDGLLPLLQVLVHFAPLHEGLGVLGLHAQAKVQGGECFLVFAEFNLADSLVQA